MISFFKVILNLVLSTALLISCHTRQAQSGSTIQLLVGTYTDKGSEGIYSFDFNTVTGELSNQTLQVKTPSPSYIIYSSDKKFVYAVNEAGEGNISAFRKSTDGKGLELINTVESRGEAPCHLALSPDGTKLAVANYMGGNTFFTEILPSGEITGKGNSIEKKPWPYGWSKTHPRQEASHIHFVQYDRDGKWVFSVDLGADEIQKHSSDDSIRDELLEESIAFDGFQDGDGPRHLVFHPNDQFVFILNELSNSIIAASVEAARGEFTQIDHQPTLPSSYSGKSQAAAIKISSDGKFLYASNRGHNSIAIFSILDDGNLRSLGHQSTVGQWPRDFTLSPDENFLLVANEHSGNILVLKRNTETGMLSPTGQSAAVFSPTCLVF